jgi:hypothetical protein
VDTHLALAEDIQDLKTKDHLVTTPHTNTPTTTRASYVSKQTPQTPVFDFSSCSMDIDAQETGILVQVVIQHLKVVRISLGRPRDNLSSCAQAVVSCDVRPSGEVVQRMHTAPGIGLNFEVRIRKHRGIARAIDTVTSLALHARGGLGSCV